MRGYNWNMRRAAPRRTLEGEEAVVAAREQREEVTRGKEAWWIERIVPRTQWRRRERQVTRAGGAERGREGSRSGWREGERVLKYHSSAISQGQEG